MLLACLLQQVIFGYHECRYEFLLFGYYHYLIHIPIYTQLRFQHLWRYEFAVAGLEEVFDAVGEEEFAVLHIAGIARVEPSFLVDGQCCHFRLAVVALGDGVSLEQDFIVVTELQLHSVEQPAYRTYGDRFVPAVECDGCCGLCHTITYHQQETNRAHELFHLG